MNNKKNHEIKNVWNVHTQEFGLVFKQDISPKLMKKHYKKMSREEFEEELNKFAKYLFKDKRRVAFHGFRNFPYIIHADKNTNHDYAGLLVNYTIADYYFIRFIQHYMNIEGKDYYFPDVDFLIEMSELIPFNEISILEIAADEILKR